MHSTMYSQYFLIYRCTLGTDCIHEVGIFFNYMYLKTRYHLFPATLKLNILYYYIISCCEQQQYFVV